MIVPQRLAALQMNSIAHMHSKQRAAKLHYAAPMPAFYMYVLYMHMQTLKGTYL